MELFGFIKKKKANDNPKTTASTGKNTAPEILLSKMDATTRKATDLYCDDSDLGYC